MVTDNGVVIDLFEYCNKQERLRVIYREACFKGIAKGRSEDIPVMFGSSPLETVYYDISFKDNMRQLHDVMMAQYSNRMEPIELMTETMRVLYQDIGLIK